MKTAERRFLILALALGLAAMLGAAVQHRLAEPSLVKRAPHSPQAAAAAPQAETEVGRLMREMGERPDDPGVLVALAAEMMERDNLPQAEVFLGRAAVLDTANPDIPYYRGYLLHRQGDHRGAVPLMEESLAMRDRAAVRFSLGTLLAYFLDDPAAARAQFEAGLASPDCSPEQREMLSKELERLGKAGAQAGQAPAPKAP